MRKSGSLLGKVRWWAAAVLLIFSTVASLLMPVIPAHAAAGDTGDPKGLWLNAGAVKYDGKTFNTQWTPYSETPAGSTFIQNIGMMFEAGGTATCLSTITNRTIPTDFFVEDFNSSNVMWFYHADIIVASTGAQSCTPHKTKDVTMDHPELANAMFFQDGQTIKSYTGNGGVFTEKPAHGGAEKLYVNGVGGCSDAIAFANGKWYLFPMSQISQTIDLNHDAKSETYGQFTGDPSADNNCRVNSYKLSFE